MKHLLNHLFFWLLMMERLTDKSSNKPNLRSKEHDGMHCLSFHLIFSTIIKSSIMTGFGLSKDNFCQYSIYLVKVVNFFYQINKICGISRILPAHAGCRPATIPASLKSRLSSCTGPFSKNKKHFHQVFQEVENPKTNFQK
jgi:hypothetical protein